MHSVALHSSSQHMQTSELLTNKLDIAFMENNFELLPVNLFCTLPHCTWHLLESLAVHHDTMTLHLPPFHPTGELRTTIDFGCAVRKPCCMLELLSRPNSKWPDGSASVQTQLCLERSRASGVAGRRTKKSFRKGFCSQWICEYPCLLEVLQCVSLDSFKHSECKSDANAGAGCPGNHF